MNSSAILRKFMFICLLAISAITYTKIANAEVTAVNKSHFTLKLVAQSPYSSEQVWKKLLKPERWWQSSHTYSGDAGNLTIEAKAGGYWREDWEGGSVLHGTILNIQENKLLRLSAPFGPLQELAVETVWTITLTPTDTGTKITFDFIANGNQESGLDNLASAVNYVKGEALKNLAK